MVRLLPLILCCLLLLGCTATAPAVDPSDASPAPPSPSSAFLSGYYDPDSSLEAATQGALRVYPLKDLAVTGIRAMGSQLLVFSGSDLTTLTLLTGETLKPAASAVLPFSLTSRDPSLVLSQEGLSYFDPLHRQTVVLDNALREVSRIAAPEGLLGTPILSQAQDVLYYCTANAIRAWDLETGFHRQLKEVSLAGQHLTGLYLEDRILSLCVPEAGSSRTMLLSTQTGKLLFSHSGDFTFSGGGQQFFAVLSSGMRRDLLWGDGQSAPQLFLPAGISNACYYLEPHNGAISVSLSASGQQALDYYALSSGKRLSSLCLEPGQCVLGAAALTDGSTYLLMDDPNSGCQAVVLWDTGPDTPLAAADTGCHIFPYVLPGSSRPEEMAQCQAYAAELGEKYGIGILVWEDAVRIQPWNFDLEPEYQPSVLQRELELLDQRLSQFPSNFLPDTASHFSSLKLCIAGQITAAAESGSTAPQSGLQFYDGTDAYIVIAAGQHSADALYHNLFHVMETHIFTNSTAFDQWQKLNPMGFSYSYQTLSALDSANTLYLEGQDQAFAGREAMAFPKEDRAGILEAAMQPGKKALFVPWMMQRKLVAVCQGIREAYGWTEIPQAFPWEQYLDHPISYGS